MSALRLSKGQNVVLGSAQVRIRLVSDPAGGLDTSAIAVSAAGRVRSDADFVFYNQPTHPSGAIRHRALGDGDAVEITTADIERAVDRVVITASVHSGTLARYGRAQVVVTDRATGADLLGFDVVGEGSEAALVLAEIYRRGDGWKIRAVSQGYAAGLAGLAADYGIDVAGPAASSPTAAVSQVSPPAGLASAPAPASVPASGADRGPVDAPAPVAPPPVVDEAQREMVRAIMFEYGRTCEELVQLCDQANKSAHLAVAARAAANQRPQHEISIRNFETMARRHEDDFSAVFSALQGACRRVRDVGGRIHDMSTTVQFPFQPEMTLVIVLDGDDLYGSAAVGSFIARVPWVGDPSTYTEAFRALNADLPQLLEPNVFDINFPGYVLRPEQSQAAPSHGVL